MAEDLLPRPPELEPDIQFWIKVYSQISTNEGYLHDQHRLSVIYETVICISMPIRLFTNARPASRRSVRA